MSVKADEIQADCAKVRQLVYEVCRKGDRAWQMSIPVNPDDSDRLLMRTLDHVSALLAENEQLRQVVRSTAQIIEAREINSLQDALLRKCRETLGDTDAP